MKKYTALTGEVYTMNDIWQIRHLNKSQDTSESELITVQGSEALVRKVWVDCGYEETCIKEDAQKLPRSFGLFKVSYEQIA